MWLVWAFMVLGLFALFVLKYPASFRLDATRFLLTAKHENTEAVQLSHNASTSPNVTAPVEQQLTPIAPSPIPVKHDQHQAVPLSNVSAAVGRPHRRERGRHKGAGRATLYQTDFRWPAQSQARPVPILRSASLSNGNTEHWLQPTNGPADIAFQSLQLYRNFTKHVQLWHTSALPEPDRIPSILHQIWIGDKTLMPWHIMYDAMAMLGNWTFMLWTEQNLSWVPYTHLYHRFRRKPPIQKATDLARYAILYRYGGWYIDSDIQLLRRLEPLNSALVEGADCLIIHEGNKQAPLYLANGILGCRKHSAAMKFVLQSLPFRDFKQNDHKCTGPRLVADINFRDERRPVFTILPANTFICSGWSCPKPSCTESLTRYGWHWHLRFVVWEGTEVSSKAQPLYTPCEKHSSVPPSLTPLSAMPNSPPVFHCPQCRVVRGYCAALKRHVIEEEAATYMVRTVESKHHVVLMDVDGQCLGDREWPNIPMSSAGISFGSSGNVVFLDSSNVTKQNGHWQLLQWNMSKDSISVVPLHLPKQHRPIAGTMECNAVGCFILTCTPCHRTAICPKLLHVSLQNGTVQTQLQLNASMPYDSKSADASPCADGAQVLMTDEGHAVFLVLPFANIILKVDIATTAVSWSLKVPTSVTVNGTHVSVQSIVAATLMPSTTATPADKSDVMLAVLVQLQGSSKMSVLFIDPALNSTALLSLGGARKLDHIQYLWLGLLVASGRTPDGTNTTLVAWNISGPPRPVWTLSSRTQFSHSLFFLPYPHISTSDIWTFEPSTPVTLTFSLWNTRATAHSVPGTLLLLNETQEIARQNVTLWPHWQRSTATITFIPTLPCDLHFLRALLYTNEGLHGELPVALYCNSLLTETKAWQDMLAAYRRTQRRKWGGMGLY